MSRRVGVMGGYETAAAAALIIIIASLSVWGAVLIYRAVKGQRRKRGSEDYTNVIQPESAGREDEDDWSKSTGSDDGGFEDWDVDSRETKLLSPENHTQVSSDLLEENLRQTTQENMKEPSVEHLTGNATAIGQDQMKNDDFDTDERIGVQSDFSGSQDHIGRLSEDQQSSVQEIHDDDESEVEPHADIDEPSETESAQEILEVKNLPVQKCQSVEDVSDNTLLSQEIVIKLNEEEEKTVAIPVLQISSDTTSVILHKNTKVETVETKAFEKSVPLMNDPDSYCYDVQADLLSNLAFEKVMLKKDVRSHQDFIASSLQRTVGNREDRMATQQHMSNTFDHILTSPPQNYLGFTVPDFQGGSVVPLQLAKVSNDRIEVTPADSSQQKNEISIMDAIMDSNEWLSTGQPDTRDQPWLTPNKTGYGFNASPPVQAIASLGFPAEEMSQDEKRDVPENTTTNVPKDEGDVLNKKVGTVLPMPKLVQVSFRVHYITHSPNQFLAVTGNQQELGSWESFVPLKSVENGFWFCSIGLPLESQVEWKFILVEEGKIQRWEESENRYFTVTGQEEEINLRKNWGYL